MSLPKSLNRGSVGCSGALRGPGASVRSLLLISLVASGFLLLGNTTAVAQGSATPGPSSATVTDLTVGEESFTIVKFGIEADSAGLLNRSDEAMNAVAESLAQVFQPLTGCEIVFGLIFAGSEGQEAIETASMIAEVIYLEFTELSERATFGRLSLNDPETAGRAELTLYFRDGCEPLSTLASPESR